MYHYTNTSVFLLNRLIEGGVSASKIAKIF